MRSSILFAVLAGVAWGVGGYFEKAGLRSMGIPPIAGITVRTLVALVVLGLISIPSWKLITNPSNTNAWLMIIIGGGIIAGSLGMWSFYSSLSVSENLGVTLAIAFACSPLAGTVVGLARGDQPFNNKNRAWYYRDDSWDCLDSAFPRTGALRPSDFFCHEDTKALRQFFMVVMHGLLCQFRRNAFGKSP